MPGGKPRKPAAKLKLHDTYRKDRHGDRFDDSGLSSECRKPLGLSPLASDFWDEVVPPLFAAGIGKEPDLPAARGMCEWWAKYREAMQLLEGAEGLKPVTMLQVQSLASNAWKNFLALASRFGMTPVDRAKLAAQPDRKASDFDKDIADSA